MHRTNKAGITLAVLALATPSAHAQTYDDAKDFSATSNPNGVWSYGYENSLGSPLKLYTDSASRTFSGWVFNGNPNVVKNFCSTDGFDQDVVLHPGQMKLHPGPNGEYSIVRFTASHAGSYSLSGGFTPVTTDGTATDVHVLKNGTALFDGIVTGTYKAPTSAPSFSSSFFLNSGDTVDFAVGFGSDGDYFRNSTGLAATLATSPVPEASSSVSLGLLLLLGVGGVAVSRRRKAGA